MALNPATIKIMAKVAATAADERARRAILIVCLVPFIVLLLVLSSPFAIFFSLTSSGAMEDSISVVDTIGLLKDEFVHRIEKEQDDPAADEIVTIIMGSEDNAIIDNSSDVLAVFSTRYNVIDEGAQQMAVLDERQIEQLEAVFWDMNSIKADYEEEKETITYTTVDNEGNEIIKTKTVTRVIKTIYVECFTAEEMAAEYGFNDTQQTVIYEMKKSGLGLLISNDSKLFLSREEIERIKSLMPAGLKVERNQIVEVAKGIKGKVNYFWGGKSSKIGWDNRWGTDMEVTSTGSPTTGTIRSFGLDCSGYVTWVFINMGLPAETIGHGTTAQWNASTSIYESDALPGDLAFLAMPGTRKVNHVGIVVDVDDSGNILVAHCSSGANNVVVSTVESIGFLYFRRPAVLIK